MKRYLQIIGGWSLLLIVIFAVPLDIPIITGIAFLFFYFSALIFVIIFLFASFRYEKKRDPVIAILLVIIICGVMFNKGLFWGAKLHLLANKSRYETIRAKLVSAQNQEEREKICSEDCAVLSEESMRVAFHFSHWFLNWKDIVYDPTGAVNIESPPPDQRLNLYFIKGERLAGDWYLCHFSD